MKSGNRILTSFQKFGKVLMAPVLLLPIAGILVGIGSAFSNPNLIKTIPLLGNPFLTALFKLTKDLGNVINNNIPIIFAMSIAYGFAKKEKATAAISGFIAYMGMNSILGSFLILNGTINPEKLLTGQKMILGITTLDTGVFGGILIGLVVSVLHNRYYKIELPAVLSIFNGTRFVPAISLIVSGIVGIVLAFIFPPVQLFLNSAADFIAKTGAIGSFVYGLAERLLLPFGLHHFIYLPFFFTSLGGVKDIGGQVYEGAVNIQNAILNTPNAMYDIDVSKYLMNGKVIFAMFGLAGAAFAIYKTTRPENKKKIASLMIASTIPCVIMGISEPLEYSFLFVAPLLFGLHAVFSGLAYVITYLVNFNVSGSATFGGPLLSLIFNGILGADKGSNWTWILVLGPIYFALYYFVFSFLIKKFNYLTPGRETEKIEEVQEKNDSSFNLKLVEALGGEDNISAVDACFTRLRVTLKDNAKVKSDSYFSEALNAKGVVHVDNGIQIIYGAKASIYKTELREYLNIE